jgi:filamentous hemagglutinin
VSDPLAYESIVGKNVSADQSLKDPFGSVDDLFLENGATNQTLQEKQQLHGSITTASGQNEPLHENDTTPVDIYAGTGNISGLTLYSPTETRVIAGQDITDISLYLQNVTAGQISVVSAGDNLVAYDPDSPLRTEAQADGNVDGAVINNGDIQIGGPGTVEVLAGNDLDLGVGPNGSAPGLGVGITSIGNQRNPYLPSSGADIIAMAGAGSLADLTSGNLGFSAFISQFVTGADSAIYLPELSSIETGLPAFSNAAEFGKLSKETQDIITLDVFFLVIRDAGRDHNIVGSPGYSTYNAGYEAIADLFPGPGSGDISLTSREIATENGGNVSIMDPGGALTVGVDIQGNQPLDQGIFTEDGGNISIFTKGSILVGTSRIFTLRGGNEILWSSDGNIAAGESPKTVQEAPPTQVIVDPTSANVETDLGGLATGGGIGVLASVQGVPAGNVDLIAPVGTVDAGDAGIRVTGNLNIAAAHVLNVGNIQVGGASAGVPVATIVAPNIGALTAAANSAGAGAAAAGSQINANNQSPDTDSGLGSVITVQVIGYGGDDDQE